MNKVKTGILQVILTFAAFSSPVAGQGELYLDPGQPVEVRVEDLVSRMTLEQKISQMQNGAAAIPELGIAEYDWWNECLHGVARNGIATVFPQAIGMAATWNPDLIFKEADIISTEARAKHHEAVRNNEFRRFQGLTFWSPNINIFRDPRWGRGQETYGEDPHLSSRIGVAFVKGLQGDDPFYFKVISTPKHFAVHSGPETLRHQFNAKVSDRDLRETYLPAFRACIVEGGAYSTMGAYNRFRDESCSASKLLLDSILRKDWGFRGYVVSDCGAIRDIYRGHHIVETAAEASALAVKAGCDLTCGREYLSLVEAVDRNLITEEEIDVSLRRLMTARFRLGMFDPEEMVAYARIPFSENNSEKHNEFALRVARESMVLLKNENNTLPLSPEVKSIAVVGPYADNLDVLVGNYNGTPSDPVSILKGIMNRAGRNTRVRYAEGVHAPGTYLRPTQIPPGSLRPAGNLSGHGLKAEYFDNPDLRGTPVLVRKDSLLRMFWRSGSPGEGVPRDNFSVRWTGNIVPPTSGMYEIGLFTDERSRLQLDGELLFDSWTDAGDRFFGRDTVKFEKGKEYPVILEYADLEGPAGIRLTWRKLEESGQNLAMIDEAVELARQSDVTIVVAGISPRLEGEEMRISTEGFKGGDRTSLVLPETMQNLVKSIHATGKPMVLVLTSGSALAVNWADEHVPAILEAWYPGQQGGNAVADVLFGNYNPAGRLPVTFYRSVDDLPPFEDYNMRGRTYRYFHGKPLYPFGHGLSYTEFKYGNLSISGTEVKDGDTVLVSLNLTNTGKSDGDEVVQLYVRDLESELPQPFKSLKGFKRVSLQAGETGKVEIPLAVSDLGYWDANQGGFVTEPGEFEIQLGASSADIRQKIRLIVR